MAQKTLIERIQELKWYDAIQNLRSILLDLFTIGNSSIKTITAGTNITIDDTDPQNIVVSSNGSGNSYTRPYKEVNPVSDTIPYSFEVGDESFYIGVFGDEIIFDGSLQFDTNIELHFQGLDTFPLTLTVQNADVRTASSWEYGNGVSTYSIQRGDICYLKKLTDEGEYSVWFLNVVSKKRNKEVKLIDTTNGDYIFQLEDKEKYLLFYGGGTINATIIDDTFNSLDFVELVGSIDASKVTFVWNNSGESKYFDSATLDGTIRFWAKETESNGWQVAGTTL